MEVPFPLGGANIPRVTYPFIMTMPMSSNLYNDASAHGGFSSSVAYNHVGS